MGSPPGTSLQPASSRASSVRIPGRWLPFARGVWMVCALLVLANFVASIPAYYQLLNTVCTLPDPSNCATGQLTHVSLWLRPSEPSRQQKTWQLTRIAEEENVEA